MRYKRSKADLCLYYKWIMSGGLILWVSWIDDCLCVSKENLLLKAKKELLTRFDCNDTGNMDKYVSCKVERNWEEKWI